MVLSTSGHHHGARNVTLGLQICGWRTIHVAGRRLFASRWYKTTILAFITFLYLVQLMLIQTCVMRHRHDILKIILNIFAKSVTTSGLSNILWLLNLTIWCVIILLKDPLEFFVSLVCRINSPFCFNLIVIFIVGLNTFFLIFVHLRILVLNLKTLLQVYVLVLHLFWFLIFVRWRYFFNSLVLICLVQWCLLGVALDHSSFSRLVVFVLVLILGSRILNLNFGRRSDNGLTRWRIYTSGLFSWVFTAQRDDSTIEGDVAHIGRRLNTL